MSPHPFTAALYIGRRYSHHRSFASLDAAAAWGAATFGCNPEQRVRIEVARITDGHALPFATFRFTPA